MRDPSGPEGRQCEGGMPRLAVRLGEARVAPTKAGDGVATVTGLRPPSVSDARCFPCRGHACVTHPARRAGISGRRETVGGRTVDAIAAPLARTGEARLAPTGPGTMHRLWPMDCDRGRRSTAVHPVRVRRCLTRLARQGQLRAPVCRTLGADGRGTPCPYEPALPRPLPKTSG